MQRNPKRLLIALAAVAALGAGGTAIAVAAGGGDDDAGERPITGSALTRASQAALDHTGGGRVTGSEAGDEDGAYEVEVTRADGSEVDVHLDRGFRVLGSESERGGEDEGAGED